MIRNLKVLFGAALVLVAVGAISASGAQAAEFHCSVEPCRYRASKDPSVSAKTYHHVFIVDDITTGGSVSFTCPTITGEGRTETKTSASLTLENINYNDEAEPPTNTTKCLVNGSGELSVNMMGCDYRFFANGEVEIVCVAPNEIRIELKTGCVISVPPQKLKGITYHNTGVAPKREVTVEANVKDITGIKFAGGAAKCFGIAETDKLEGTYTTGNTTVTAETDVATPVRADGWWE
jgi:hypothetical protein